MDLYGRINLTTLAVEETDLTVAQLADRLGFNTVKSTDLSLLGYYPQRNVDSNLDEYQVYGTPTLTFDALNNTVKVERVGEDLPLEEAKRLARLNVDQQLNAAFNGSYVYDFVDQSTMLTVQINVPLTENILLAQIRDQALSAAALWTTFIDAADTPPLYGSFICGSFELVMPDNTYALMATTDAINFLRGVAFYRSGWVFAARTAKDDITAATSIAALQALSADLTTYLPGSLPPCT